MSTRISTRISLGTWRITRSNPYTGSPRAHASRCQDLAGTKRNFFGVRRLDRRTRENPRRLRSAWCRARDLQPVRMRWVPASPSRRPGGAGGVGWGGVGWIGCQRRHRLSAGEPARTRVNRGHPDPCLAQNPGLWPLRSARPRRPAPHRAPAHAREPMPVCLGAIRRPPVSPGFTLSQHCPKP